MLIRKEQLNPAETFLLKGLNQVEIGYLEWEYHGVEREFQRPEKTFSAELYHQLRINQELENYTLKIHFDITKRTSLNNNNPCLNGFKPSKIEPDIVFHGGQNNLEKQALVAEIKMEGVNNSDILYDLNKLLYYKLSFLNFKNACFIYSGYDTDLSNKLNGYIGDKFLECIIKHEIIVATRVKGKKNNQWGIFKFYQQNL